MTTRKAPILRKGFALLLAGCALFGVAATYIGLVGGMEGGAVLLWSLKFLSYFTILSNLLVASLSIRSAFPPAGVGRPWGDPYPPALRGAAILCISMTGLVYHFLLRDVWRPEGLALAGDVFCHYVTPLAFIADWAVFGTKGRMAWKHAVAWMGIPLTYAGMALALGPLIGYPYPFLDLGKLGWAGLAPWIGILLAVFALLSSLIVLADAALGRAFAGEAGTSAVSEKGS